VHGRRRRVRVKQSVYRPIGAQPRPATWRDPDLRVVSRPRGGVSSACTLLGARRARFPLPVSGFPSGRGLSRGGRGLLPSPADRRVLDRAFKARWACRRPSERGPPGPAGPGRGSTRARSTSDGAGAPAHGVRRSIRRWPASPRQESSSSSDELGVAPRRSRPLRRPGEAAGRRPVARARSYRSQIGRRAHPWRACVLLLALGGSADDELRRARPTVWIASLTCRRSGRRCCPASVPLGPPQTISLSSMPGSRNAPRRSRSQDSSRREAPLKLALDARLIHSEAAALVANALVIPPTRPGAIAWMARTSTSSSAAFPRALAVAAGDEGRACEEESIPIVDSWSRREAGGRRSRRGPDRARGGREGAPVRGLPRSACRPTCTRFSRPAPVSSRFGSHPRERRSLGGAEDRAAGRESGLEVVLAQRDVAVRPFDPDAGDAGLAQPCEVVGEVGLRPKLVEAGAVVLAPLARPTRSAAAPDRSAPRARPTGAICSRVGW